MADWAVSLSCSNFNASDLLGRSLSETALSTSWEHFFPTPYLPFLQNFMWNLDHFWRAKERSMFQSCTFSRHLFKLKDFGGLLLVDIQLIQLHVLVVLKGQIDRITCVLDGKRIILGQSGKKGIFWKQDMKRCTKVLPGSCKATGFTSFSALDPLELGAVPKAPVVLTFCHSTPNLLLISSRFWNVTFSCPLPSFPSKCRMTLVMSLPITKAFFSSGTESECCAKAKADAIIASALSSSLLPLSLSQSPFTKSLA